MEETDTKTMHEIVAEQMERTGANLPLEELAENKEMTEGKRDSFVFYWSFATAISRLPDAEQLEMYRAITTYGLKRKRPTFLNPIMQAIWALIEPQLDANWRRYENGCKGGAFGKLGGAPIGNKNAQKLKQPQNNPKTTPNDNDNVNHNVNDNTKKTTKVVKERHSLSFDERKTEFWKTIIDYNKRKSNKYSLEMLEDFFAYWAQEDNTGKDRLRWEAEKYWNLPMRLATWNRREDRYDNKRNY